jgi:hypothetical protein
VYGLGAGIFFVGYVLFEVPMPRDNQDESQRQSG